MATFDTRIGPGAVGVVEEIEQFPVTFMFQLQVVVSVPSERVIVSVFGPTFESDGWKVAWLEPVLEKTLRTLEATAALFNFHEKASVSPSTSLPAPVSTTVEPGAT